MIPSIVLDPSFFWVFSASDTEQVAETVWKTCRPWLNDDNHGATLLVHGKSIERLQEKGLIPAFEGMRKLVERLNLAHVVSPHELSRVVDRFLSNMVTMEEMVPVPDALLEDTSFAPDELSVIEDCSLRDHSHDSAALSALNCSMGNALNYAFPRLSNDVVRVEIQGTVTLAESSDGTAIPAQFAHCLLLLRDPAQFRSLLKPQEIWDHAVDDAELKFAILLAAERLIDEPLEQFRIGAAFIASLRRNQAIAGIFATATLAKCAQTLADVDGLSINEFKYEAVGNKAAKVRVRPRDGAKAYRVHIPSGALGLRLMLWKLPTGNWEFANVGPKNEEMIEMG